MVITPIIHIKTMDFLFQNQINEDYREYKNTEKANFYAFVYTKLNNENITRRSCLSVCDLGSTARTLDKFYEIESCSLGSLIIQSISGYRFLF
jgi:hypothetical protein